MSCSVSVAVTVCSGRVRPVDEPAGPEHSLGERQRQGGKPRVATMAGGTVTHIFLNGDARVYAVDDDAAPSADVFCYVPRPPK